MDTVAVLGREYRPRVIDSAVQRALAASGAGLGVPTEHRIGRADPELGLST